MLSWAPAPTPCGLSQAHAETGPAQRLSLGGQCGPNIWGVLQTWPGFSCPSLSPDTLLSQQPSEDLVPYDTDLYQRQTHEYYPYLSSDGESHSGEYRDRPAPQPQPGLAPE